MISSIGSQLSSAPSSSNFVLSSYTPASVDYLVLDISEGELLGQIDRVVVSDKRIYVGDYKNQKIFVFDEVGRMQGVLTLCLLPTQPLANARTANSTNDMQ
jgi:hypothetical protein